MKILITTKKPKAFKAFEEVEWPIADIEHYGNKTVNFDKKHYFLKAVETGQIWGILQMQLQAGVADITDVIVSHKKRGQGIGKKLMSQAEKIAKDSGAHKLFLITGKDWLAVGFYQSLGFEITGERKNDLAHADFVELTKFLDA